jgi:hypothetical protein
VTGYDFHGHNVILATEGKGKNQIKQLEDNWNYGWEVDVVEGEDVRNSQFLFIL